MKLKLFYILFLILIIVLIICLYQKDMFDGNTQIVNFNCSADPSTSLITSKPTYAYIQYQSSLTQKPT